jgi:hypothetical protein
MPGAILMSSAGLQHRQEILLFAGTDLEVRARLANTSLTIEVLKSGACVHRLILDHATVPLEHAWLADLFARDEHVRIDHLARQLEDYVSSLNTNQG